MSSWIDRMATLAVLGVRPQTLYAYASRGQIGVMPDPQDPRRSLYRVEDIETLATRRGRGRRVARIAESTMDWGEPAITTSISTIQRGTLIYRGRSATMLAAEATLEQAAELLWQATSPVVFPPVAAPRDPWRALAAVASTSQPILGRGSERLLRDAALAVGAIAASVCGSKDRVPVHERIAAAWSLKAGDAERIRQALVLLADHELNASTFATRVAASTGASMAASLLAGLSALSGPRHGGAGAALMALIGDADRLGAPRAVSEWLARGQDLPGFGHPLYPDGDPRAAMLLDDFKVDPPLSRLRQAAEGATGRLPNIDFALVALTRTCGLPDTAPFSLFLLGRSVGWAAHTMEQLASGTLIRPRARYVGPRLTTQSLTGIGSA